MPTEAPPAPVRRAAALLRAACALWVLGAAAGTVQVAATEPVDALPLLLLVLAPLTAVAVAVTWALAGSVRSGRRWARAALTVLAALAAASTAVALGGPSAPPALPTALEVVTTALLVTAVVLLHRPASSAHFRRTSAAARAATDVRSSNTC